MNTQINSLVYDYLSAVSPEFANKFKEVAKPEELPADSPKLKEIYSAVISSLKDDGSSKEEIGSVKKVSYYQQRSYAIITMSVLRMSGFGGNAIFSVAN